MALDSETVDRVNTKSQIGNPDDITGIPVIGFNEVFVLEEGTSKIYKHTLGNSWICGSSTNGIVGTNTGTEGGGQQVVGASSRDTNIQQIYNPNNTFYENFRDDVYSGSGTSDWDYTTDFQLEMTTGETRTSAIIAKHPTLSYSKATIFLTLSSGLLTDLVIKLSADGGSNKETVTHGEEHIFTNTSSAGILYDITASGTVNISKIKIIYS
jgi:hypothetical protein